MKVRKLLVAALLLTAAVSYGQQNAHHPNVITTGVPFLAINPDSRGGGLGDCGVASSADVYSMHYNPAKYVYLEDKLSIGLGYSPWLRNLVNDMGLAYLAGAYKINDRSAVAASLRYFNAGQVDFNAAFVRIDFNGVVNRRQFIFREFYVKRRPDYLRYETNIFCGHIKVIGVKQC